MKRKISILAALMLSLGIFVQSAPAVRATDLPADDRVVVSDESSRPETQEKPVVREETAESKPDNPVPPSNPDRPYVRLETAKRDPNKPSKLNVTFEPYTTGTCYFELSKDKPKNIFDTGKKMVVSSTELAGLPINDVGDEATTLWVAMIDTVGYHSELSSVRIPAVRTIRFSVKPKNASFVMKRKTTTIKPQSKKKNTLTFKLIRGMRYSYTVQKSGYSTYSNEMIVSDNRDIEIRLVGGECRLSDLSVSSSPRKPDVDFTLSPEFSGAVKEYTAQTDTDLNEIYLWVRKRSSSSVCHVYGADGISDSCMREDRSLFGEKEGGYQRYKAEFAQGCSEAEIQVTVTADSGKSEGYILHLNKADNTAPEIVCTSAERVEDGDRTRIEAFFECSEQAVGYVRAVNPGVVPSSVTDNATRFTFNKGVNAIAVGGLTDAACDLYFAAEDDDHNMSQRIRLSVPAKQEETDSDGFAVVIDDQKEQKDSAKPATKKTKMQYVEVEPVFTADLSRLSDGASSSESVLSSGIPAWVGLLAVALFSALLVAGAWFYHWRRTDDE